MDSLYVLGQVMDLGAVLVWDDRSLSGSRIGAQNNAILEDDADDGGAGFGGRRWLEAPLQKSRIAKIKWVVCKSRWRISSELVYSYRLQLSKLKPGRGRSRALSKSIVFALYFNYIHRKKLCLISAERNDKQNC